MTTTTELLILAPCLPHPAGGPDCRRAFQMLHFLSQRYRVHLGCLSDPHQDAADSGRLRALCHETCFARHAPLAAHARALAALACGEAPAVAAHANATLAAWCARLLRQRRVAAALVLSVPMAQYLMPAGGLRRIVDLSAAPARRAMPAPHGGPLAALRRRAESAGLAYEGDIARQFDGVAVATPAAAARLLRAAPEAAGKLAWVCDGVDAEHYWPHGVHRNPYRPGTVALLYSGLMDRWPDIEAADWFVRRVFAPLHALHGCLRLHIVGPRPDARVRALARHPGVLVEGAVPDLRPHLAHAALVVAPQRLAAGLQDKVLAAMAMQKVVVASPAALDGIAARPGAELLEATDTASFIALVKRALAADGARAMGMAARARVLADYNWNGNLGRLAALIDGSAHPDMQAPSLCESRP